MGDQLYLSVRSGKVMAGENIAFASEGKVMAEENIVFAILSDSRSFSSSSRNVLLGFFLSSLVEE